MKALIIVDVQKDFLPGGSLAVPEGESIIPAINSVQEEFDLVAATQDWHPPDHLSFAAQHEGSEPFDRIDLNGVKQILWPEHCIWDTEGASFPDALDLSQVAAIFRKGMDRTTDSYSGFFDINHQRSTGLHHWLDGMGVKEVCIAGLAAEVCVAYTALDAVMLDFPVTILTNGTRALDVGDFGRVKDRLQQCGVRFVDRA